MAKKSEKTVVDAVDSVDEEAIAIDEAEVIKEATRTTGRTPRDVQVIMREMAKMLEAVKLSKIERLEIGTYFVPHEGQLGVEGLIHAGNDLMNRYVEAGWMPWGMGAPYHSQASFSGMGAGGETGVLDGQWITIIWAKPAEELQ